MLQKTAHFDNYQKTQTAHLLWEAGVHKRPSLTSVKNVEIVRVAGTMLAPMLNAIPERVSSAICTRSRNLILLRTYHKE